MKNLTLLLFIAAAMAACTPKYGRFSDNSARYADKYADKLEEGSTLVRSYYNYTVEKTRDGKYIHKIFYPDTRQITHFMTYTDAALKNADGPYSEWWDNGQPFTQGQYVKGEKEGEWKFYQFDQDVNSGIYKHGKREGLWVTHLPEGRKTAEYNYRNGELNGSFKQWNEEGQLTKEGSYLDGELEWEKDYNENEPAGGTAILNVVEEQPRFPGCEDLTGDERKKCSDEKMLVFIYSNIKYPAFARENGIEGTALIRFVVEKDGSIREVETMRGICKEIKEECERIVRLMPDWYPGKQHGVPVRVQFNLPVKFKLE